MTGSSAIGGESADPVDGGSRPAGGGAEVIVTLLGPFAVSVGGRPALLGSDRLRSVLALLALSVGEPVSLPRLAAAVWGDEQPADARRTLQLYVTRLRRALGSEAIQTVPGGYLLDTPPANVDAVRFAWLLDDAARAKDQDARRTRLVEALELWQGIPFEDLKSPWLADVESTRLVERYLTAVEHLVDMEITNGRASEVVARLSELTARYPLRERFWGQLMLALFGTGRQADALQTYQRLYRLLADELGMEPSEGVQELHRQILAAEAAPASAGLGPVTPPPASSPVPKPRQLPADVAAFTGRLAELTDLDRLPDTTSVVITSIDGMPGIGKTALAVHAAHRFADRYPDGQLFVDLHGHTPGVVPRRPTEVLEHMLRALGVPGTQIPSGLDERAALYRSQLADQRILVLLDNAATEAQVRPLLPGAPGSLVLITSRHRLAGLDHSYTLSLDTLPTRDAIRLFVHTAGAGRLRDQQPALLTELVELCGRLPLAIRIAAARMRSHRAWDLSHLLERLRDQRRRLSELEAGQRSVTAALDLSYQHLSPDQQHAYRLLGLHPGHDITAEATAALLDRGVSHAGRVLDQLLDANLLHEPTPGRYRFHDLIRAHAAHTQTSDQLGSTGRAALHRLLDHYRHTAALAVDAAYPHDREQRPSVPPARTPAAHVPGLAEALAWLDTELPNLLAAARYAAEHGWPDHVLHLSAILHRHLRTRGHYSDAETLHRWALVTARAAGDRAGELAALTGLGHINRLQGRWVQATEDHQQAVRIARATRQQAAELDALNGLGQIHRRRGRYEQAVEHYQQALGIARATGYRTGELDALVGLGDIYRRQDRYTEAIDHYQQALGIARATGYRTGELIVLIGLGHSDRMRGRYEPAAHHYQQALGIARATGYRTGELVALAGIGDLHRREGRYNQAADHYGQLLDLALEGGDRNLEFEARQGLGRLWHVTGDAEAALVHHEHALTLAGELGQPLDQARAHDGLAHAHHALGQHRQAREQWRLALDILVDVGVGHTDDEEATAAAIRAHLAAYAESA